MTLKSGLEVTRDHSKWYHSKAWVWFLIRLPYGSILHHLRDRAQYWSRMVIFFMPFAFDAPVRGGVPVGILASSLVWEN